MKCKYCHSKKDLFLTENNFSSLSKVSKREVISTPNSYYCTNKRCTKYMYWQGSLIEEEEKTYSYRNKKGYKSYV